VDEFGLFTWGSAGVPELSPASFTMRVVYSGLTSGFPAGKYFDIAIEGVSAQNAAAFCVPVAEVNATRDKQLEPEVLNGVVRVWRTLRGDPYGDSGSTNTTMRLVVVRFK
jgi:hypothetical protein